MTNAIKEELKFEPTREEAGVKTPHGLEKAVGVRGLYRRHIGSDLVIWLNVADLRENDIWAFDSRSAGIRRTLPGNEVKKILSDKKVANLNIEGFNFPIAREDIEVMMKFADELRTHDKSLLYYPTDIFNRIPIMK